MDAVEASWRSCWHLGSRVWCEDPKPLRIQHTTHNTEPPMQGVHFRPSPFQGEGPRTISGTWKCVMCGVLYPQRSPSMRDILEIWVRASFLVKTLHAGS
jgi:hypothetical protein